MVVLFVGFSICLWVRCRMGPTNCYEERGIIHGYETDDKQCVYCTSLYIVCDMSTAREGAIVLEMNGRILVRFSASS